MTSEEKVIVFIDGSNLYNELKRNFGKGKADIHALAAKLTGKRKLIKIYYYSAPYPRKTTDEQYKKEQRFFVNLGNTPRVEVKLGRYEQRPNGPPVEKGVDVLLAADMILNAVRNVYDTAILISCDADFVPVVKIAQSFGKDVENLRFQKSKSHHLNKVCDKTICLKKADVPWVDK